CRILLCLLLAFAEYNAFCAASSRRAKIQRYIPTISLILYKFRACSHDARRRRDISALAVPRISSPSMLRTCSLPLSPSPAKVKVTAFAATHFHHFRLSTKVVLGASQRRDTNVNGGLYRLPLG